MYKNRMTNILRQAKKQYYDKMLQMNKNNMKRTWNILNNVTANKLRSANQPKHFIKDNKVFGNLTEAADEFNSFFCECGAELGKGYWK